MKGTQLLLCGADVVALDWRAGKLDKELTDMSHFATFHLLSLFICSFNMFYKRGEVMSDQFDQLKTFSFGVKYGNFENQRGNFPMQKGGGPLFPLLHLNLSPKW